MVSRGVIAIAVSVSTIGSNGLIPKRSDCGNGKGGSSTPFTMEKIAVVAPTPRASISTAVAEKAGDFIKCRTAICRSWNGTVLASRIEIEN